MAMKRPKTESVHDLPWTPFVEIGSQNAKAHVELGTPAPSFELTNSRYHVTGYVGEDPKLGLYVHLSIKDHDRSTRHDWRDLQRIKNECVGPEFEAIEIYPAESRLVDAANQYHLFVFQTWVPPVGFVSRLVVDHTPAMYAKGAQQRPFEDRPKDCLTGGQFDRLMVELRKRKGLDSADAWKTAVAEAAS